MEDTNNQVDFFDLLLIRILWNLISGCDRFLLPDDGCNHSRAWQFFQASLRKPQGFPAIKCASYDDFLRIDKGGKCGRNDIIYMGLYANRTFISKNLIN
jgi:hypothetical protein